MWDRLRKTITIVIIGIGITSLVGILTATEALQAKLSESLQQITTERITLSALEGGRHRGITLFEAEALKSSMLKYLPEEAISIYAAAPLPFTASSEGGRSSPNLQIILADGEYLGHYGLNISQGRNIKSKNEINNLSIIGHTAASQLRAEIGGSFSLGGREFKICGILEKSGESGYGGADNSIIFPIGSNAAPLLPSGTSYRVSILPMGRDAEWIVERTTLLMRTIRRLSPGKPDNFAISSYSNERNRFNRLMEIIVAISFGIGIITLFGASVALMNIMMVSVKERTREIGLKKAVGATPARIAGEFLQESVGISLKGSLWGILFGIPIGNLTALLLEASFIMPWQWILCAIGLAVLIGLLSGYIPAKEAAGLTPIVALAEES